jgi:excisionase family DNA binding protein
MAAALWLASATALGQSAPGAEVLNLDEAAALLRVSPEVVQAMAEGQRIPARRVGDVWRFGHDALIEWLKGEQFASAAKEMTVVGGLGRAESLQHELAGITGRGRSAAPPTASAHPSTATGVETAPAQTTLGERPSAPTSEEIALRDERVLLGRGAATIEFGAVYGKSTQTLVPVIRMEEKDMGVSGTLRYGLKDDLQLTALVPATWRRTTTYTDASVSGTSSPLITTSKLGIADDASLSLLGVAGREAMRKPTIVWSLDGVVPTGAGDSALGGGLVLSKSYDPAVLYTGLSYLYGMHINPADSRFSLAKQNFGFQVGYTYAINESLALTTGFAGTYRNYQSPDGTSIPPPRENYALQFGTTWLLTRTLFMEPAVAMSIGGDNPGLTLSLDFSRSLNWKNKP